MVGRAACARCDERARGATAVVGGRDGVRGLARRKGVVGDGGSGRWGGWGAVRAAYMRTCPLFISPALSIEACVVQVGDPKRGVISSAASNALKMESAWLHAHVHVYVHARAHARVVYVSW